VQSNMTLAVEFKGAIQINGRKAGHEGSVWNGVTRGGFISPSNTQGAAVFGAIMSVNKAAAADVPTEFFVGASPDTTNSVIAGPLLFEPAVAQQEPAKASWLFNGLPATVVVEGVLLYGSYGKTATNAIDPVPGCRVIANNTTGVIQFIPAGSAVASGWTQLNCTVIGKDPDTGDTILDFFTPAS